VILRNRSLLALLVAEVVSGIGTRMTYLALPWFVLATTGSPTKMGLVLAAELLPMGILGIPSGSVVSRLGARTTMLVSDLARVPLMASLPVLHAAGLLSFPLLLVLVAGFGCFWAPYFASQRSILPELLGDDEQKIAQANSVVEGASYTSGLLGPPIAGVLIALFGAANVIYIDAATFLFSFVVVGLFVTKRRAEVAAGESGGVFAGLAFLRHDALLGPLLVVPILYNALGQMLVAGLPVLAFQKYGDPKVGGWLFMAFGIGGVIGTLLAFKLVTVVEPLKLASAAVLGIALPIWVLALHAPLAPVLVALIVSAAANPTCNAPFFGIITKRTPPALLPKVMTALLTAATIAGPLGLLAAGALIEHAGLHWTFGVVAAGETVVSLLFIGLARFRRTEALLAPAPQSA
jgi:predicted MFS family arabinose efflux permease